MSGRQPEDRLGRLAAVDRVALHEPRKPQNPGKSGGSREFRLGQPSANNGQRTAGARKNSPHAQASKAELPRKKAK
jgi:hypothetical protein